MPSLSPSELRARNESRARKARSKPARGTARGAVGRPAPARARGLAKTAKATPKRLVVVRLAKAKVGSKTAKKPKPLKKPAPLALVPPARGTKAGAARNGTGTAHAAAAIPSKYPEGRVPREQLLERYTPLV